MWRNISSLMAMLVVLAIVICMGIAIGIILPRFIQTQYPKKGILSISGSNAFYDSTTNTLWITIRGIYQGIESARIVSIKILIPNSVNTIPVKVISGSNLLIPNSYFKIIAKASTTWIPERILVEVTYCFEDDTCQASARIIKIEKNPS